MSIKSEVLQEAFSRLLEDGSLSALHHVSEIGRLMTAELERISVHAAGPMVLMEPVEPAITIAECSPDMPYPDTRITFTRIARDLPRHPSGLIKRPTPCRECPWRKDVVGQTATSAAVRQKIEETLENRSPCHMHFDLLCEGAHRHLVGGDTNIIETKLDFIHRRSDPDKSRRSEEEMESIRRLHRQFPPLFPPLTVTVDDIDHEGGVGTFDLIP